MSRKPGWTVYFVEPGIEFWGSINDWDLAARQKGYESSSDKPQVMVPEEATDRGPILKGELISSEIRVPDLLAQFEKITPKSKKAKIYFYPTVEQAKTLYLSRSPFTFAGSWYPREGTRENLEIN